MNCARQPFLRVPVVASGGAGTLEHLAEVLLAGKADAVLAASIFQFRHLYRGRCKTIFDGEKNSGRL